MKSVIVALDLAVLALAAPTDLAGPRGGGAPRVSTGPRGGRIVGVE